MSYANMFEMPGRILEDCLHPIVVSMPILMGILNLTHAIDVIYKYEDGSTKMAILMLALW